MKSTADISAIATYVAGGGLAGVFVFVGMIEPKYATIANGAAVALVSVAGIVRILANPTPTYSSQVFDRTTGSTVEVKTVTPPSSEPAPPPKYTTP